MGLQLSINATVQYYISPQLRIQAWWKLSHTWQNSDVFYIVDYDNPELIYTANGNFGKYANSNYHERKSRNNLNISMIYSFF